MPIVPKMQVVVAGCGPSGLFAATASAEAGLRTALIAPNIEDHWTSRYCVWEDEWPDSLRHCLGQRWLRPKVTPMPGHSQRLERTYASVDNPTLQAALKARFIEAGGVFIDGTAQETCHDQGGTSIVTTAGNVRARHVVDATGHRRALLPHTQAPTQFQVAVGAYATSNRDEATAGVATLMDYSPSEPSQSDSRLPSFLYALPGSQHRVFVEETVLTGRSSDTHALLWARLRQRTASLGLRLESSQPSEYCVIPMDVPVPQHTHILGFGVAGGMVHPATGYSVARAACAAPLLAETLKESVNLSVTAATQRAWRQLWSEDRLRRRALFDFGRDILATLDTDRTQRFFHAFFQLPDADIADWMSDRMSSRRLAACMLHVFRCAGSDIRRVLMRGALNRPSLLLRGLVRNNIRVNHTTPKQEAA